jgi:hypothetical protein
MPAPSEFARATQLLTLQALPTEIPLELELLATKQSFTVEPLPTDKPAMLKNVLGALLLESRIPCITELVAFDALIPPLVQPRTVPFRIKMFFALRGR